MKDLPNGLDTVKTESCGFQAAPRESRRRQLVVAKGSTDGPIAFRGQLGSTLSPPTGGLQHYRCLGSSHRDGDFTGLDFRIFQSYLVIPIGRQIWEPLT